MPLGDDMAELRGLCAQKGFEFERLPSGDFHLMQINAGHAVGQPTLRRSGFSLADAIAYLRAEELADI